MPYTVWPKYIRNALDDILLGLQFHDDDLGVCHGIKAAARALGASLSDPKPLFDALLPLASGQTANGDILLADS